MLETNKRKMVYYSICSIYYNNGIALNKDIFHWTEVLMCFVLDVYFCEIYH